MVEKYHIVDVTDFERHQFEQIGSKGKFWCFDKNGDKWLFKEGRPDTGENWAEKATSELAGLMQLPHAEYELAVLKEDDCADKPGTVCRTFAKGGDLIHGNEVLPLYDVAYPSTIGTDAARFSRIREHTVNLVLAANDNPALKLPEHGLTDARISKAPHMLVGYLLFDAWIGNTDRHHQNWGWILRRESQEPTKASLYLAPTFDHASSLGRELSDEKRRARIEGRDPKMTVGAYAKKARSAFCEKKSDTKTLTTLAAFALAQQRHPDAAEAWLEQLERISDIAIQEVFDRMPEEFISPTSSAFAVEILKFNQRRLLEERR